MRMNTTSEPFIILARRERSQDKARDTRLITRCSIMQARTRYRFELPPTGSLPRQCVEPVQCHAKCSSAMAVPGLLFGRKFSESFANFGEIEHGVVSETICALQMVKDDSLGCASKSRQRTPIPGRDDETNEPSRSPFRRDTLKLS